MIGFIEDALPRAPEGLAPERRRLVERGRYLYRTSCVLCHQVDGAGGDHLSDPYAGSFTVPNLTPHADALGGWSDRDIMRALRSGIRPDGRVLFWGFMPWDLFANLEEEDVRSLVAYLRVLPPSSLKAPLPIPAAPDHPREITWRIDLSRMMARIRRQIAK